MKLEAHASRPGLQTVDLVLLVNQMVESARLLPGEDLFIFKIDLKKAFDWIPRGRLWRAMDEELGMRGLSLLMEAARAHVAPSVLRACSNAGIQVIAAPAHVIWLLQPLGTHALSFGPGNAHASFSKQRGHAQRQGT